MNIVTTNQNPRKRNASDTVEMTRPTVPPPPKVPQESSIKTVTKTCFLLCRTSLDLFPPAKLEQLATTYSTLLFNHSKLKGNLTKVSNPNYIPKSTRIKVSLQGHLDLEADSEFKRLKRQLEDLTSRYQQDTKNVFIEKIKLEIKLSQTKLDSFIIDWCSQLKEYFLMRNKIQTNKNNLIIYQAIKNTDTIKLLSEDLTAQGNDGLLNHLGIVPHNEFSDTEQHIIDEMKIALTNSVVAAHNKFLVTKESETLKIEIEKKFLGDDILANADATMEMINKTTLTTESIQDLIDTRIKTLLQKPVPSLKKEVRFTSSKSKPKSKVKKQESGARNSSASTKTQATKTQRSVSPAAKRKDSGNGKEKKSNSGQKTKPKNQKKN